MTVPPRDANEDTVPKEPRQAAVPTIMPQAHSQAPPSSGLDSRFAPGLLLGGRYRIIARLGRGGMGEVYRADDLKLGQPVALKFLAEAFAKDAKWLRRFNEEVRIARDVAHPNVCRTYDIVEADGEHFIAMEFVDGEDLSSLLRRIGRLPADKAVEIARQLCAGLAAAHDQGVLHRDLKPANVMLDGRGRVRITDFGIAALAEEMHGLEIRSGTPAYMAPEQLAGESVSVRSDIYSLGLVLYEVFTGKEAFQAGSTIEQDRRTKTSSPTSPSSIVTDIDPLVERVIMRCLEHDPRDRPTSAIAVAAALPGGDPLAMALAAGETPSPEMVAHSGDSGAMRPGWAVAGLALAMVCALTASIAHDQVNVFRLLPMDKSPDVLLDRVRDIEKKLGYVKPHADWAVTFNGNVEVSNHLKSLKTDGDPFDRLKSGRLSVFALGYRGSPLPMIPLKETGNVTWDDPPFTQTGMTYVAVDMQGRLLEFKALPLQYDDASAKSTTGVGATDAPATSVQMAAIEPDWKSSFAAADLDIATFTLAPVVWIPPVPYDRHTGWTGAFPEHPDIPIRIEAAALRGRLVWFNVFGPWVKPPKAEGDEQPTRLFDKVAIILFPALLMLIPGAAALLAWRNMRAGRGDRRGAWRLALYLIIVAFCTWLFGGHHVWAGEEYVLVSRAVAMAVYTGVIGWVMYLAIEPFARRYWPHAIIAWTRLLSGRWRDPLVGRHVLQGAIAGGVAGVVSEVPQMIAKWVNSATYQPAINPWGLQLTPRHAVARLFEMQTSPAFFLGLFVLILLLRIILRRQWLAVVVVTALLLFVLAVPPMEGEHGVDWFGVTSGTCMAGLLMFSFVRLGLLAAVVTTVTANCFWAFPFTTDFSHWYAGIGLTGLIAFTAVAVFGFWIALAGQPLFKDELAMAGPAVRPLR